MHSLTKLTALASLLSLVPKVLASHAVFINPTNGETIRIHLDGDTSDLSEAEYYTINTTNAVPDIHYKTPAELMLLVERDICEDIATCFTQGAYNVSRLRRAKIPILCLVLSRKSFFYLIVITFYLSGAKVFPYRLSYSTKALPGPIPSTIVLVPTTPFRRT
jgi:hypothetical protein